MSATHARIPIWGILSLALAPLGEISVTVLAIAAEALVRKPPGIPLSVYLPGATLAAVLWTMVCLGTGLMSGIIALVTREQPRWLAIAGLVSTLSLALLFLYVTSVD
jgi:hypothetical protein